MRSINPYKIWLSPLNASPLPHSLSTTGEAQ